MRVCIHRGTQEIGGTCVEIESRGERLAQASYCGYGIHEERLIEWKDFVERHG